MSHRKNFNNNPYHSPDSHNNFNHPEFNALENAGIGEISLSPMGLESRSEESASYYLTLGMTHYNSFLTRSLSKDLDIAINCFKKSLEENPTQAEGYVKLASALYDKGEMDIQTAISYCDKALVINADNTEAYLVKGYFYKQLGDFKSAVTCFETVINKAPVRAAKARMAKGRTLIQEASVGFEMKDSHRLRLTISGLTHFSLGLLSLPFDNQAFGQVKTAVGIDLKINAILNTATMFKKMGLKSQAVKLYEYGCANIEQEPIFFHLLGDYYWQAGNASASIYYYGRAYELDDSNPTVGKKLSRAYQKENDSLNATRILEEVVKDDLSDFHAIYNLAQLYTDNKQYMKALYYFKELLNTDPDNPYIHSNIAYVLFKLDDFEGAIREYNAAITHGEDAKWTSTVAQTLGTIYYQVKDDYISAVSNFQLARQLDPGNLECLTTLGDLHMEQGDYEAAISVHREILKYEPENADCYAFIGYLQWQMDQNTEAIDSYERALEFDPENYIACNNLGVVYLDEFKRADMALPLFEQALSLKRDYTLASFNVARAQEALGQIKEAANTYSDTLALNAFNPEVDEDDIMDRLEELFRL